MDIKVKYRKVGWAILMGCALSGAAGCGDEQQPARAPVSAGKVMRGSVYVVASDVPAAKKIADTLAGRLAEVGFPIVTSDEAAHDLTANVDVVLRETTGILKVYVNGQPKKSYRARATVRFSGGDHMLSEQSIEYDADDGPNEDQLRTLVALARGPGVQRYLADARQRPRHDVAVDPSEDEDVAEALPERDRAKTSGEQFQCGAAEVVRTRPDEFTVHMACTSLAVGPFKAPQCRDGGVSCFDAVVAIGAGATRPTATTKATEDLRTLAGTNGVLEYRQDRACRWMPDERDASRSSIWCVFTRSALAPSLAYALPSGASIATGTVAMLRMAGPDCNGIACSTQSARPDAVVTLGPLPRSFVDAPLVAAISRATSGSWSECRSGSRSACEALAESPRPELRAAAARVLAELTTHDCSKGDRGACAEAGDLLTISKDQTQQTLSLEMYTKACDLNEPKGCSRLATVLLSSAEPAARTQALTPLQNACDGGIGAACDTRADLYSSGEVGESSASQAKKYREKACHLRVGTACAQLGQLQEACEYEDQESCDTLCRRDDIKACDGASADVKSAAEARNAKRLAQASIPRLLAQCPRDRATIVQWKGKLAAAQRAHDEAAEDAATAKLEELHGAWSVLKADLQEAITVVTGGQGPRFESLRTRARLACVGHE